MCFLYFFLPENMRRALGWAGSHTDWFLQALPSFLVADQIAPSSSILLGDFETKPTVFEIEIK